MMREAFSFTFQQQKIVNHEKDEDADAECMKYENTETRIVLLNSMLRWGRWTLNTF